MLLAIGNRNGNHSSIKTYYGRRGDHAGSLCSMRVAGCVFPETGESDGVRTRFEARESGIDIHLRPKVNRALHNEIDQPAM